MKCAYCGSPASAGTNCINCGGPLPSRMFGPGEIVDVKVQMSRMPIEVTTFGDSEPRFIPGLGRKRARVTVEVDPDMIPALLKEIS